MICPACCRSDCVCPPTPKLNREQRRERVRPPKWLRKLYERGIDPFAPWEPRP